MPCIPAYNDSKLTIQCVLIRDNYLTIHYNKNKLQIDKYCTIEICIMTKLIKFKWYYSAPLQY